MDPFYRCVYVKKLTGDEDGRMEMLEEEKSYGGTGPLLK
jgi:hypothetical protein